MRTPWRRLRAAWITLTGTGAAASVAFGLLVFASVVASLAIPRDSTGLRTGALRHVVAASPGDQAVLGTIGLLTASGAFSLSMGQSPGPEMTAIGARLRSRLTAIGIPVASDPPPWSSLTSGYGPVMGTVRAAGRGQPQFEVTYRTALARYSHVVAGRLPAGGSARVVQAAVTTATAARFGLRIGSRLKAGPVPLIVTGIIQPVLPASAFWSADRLAARPLLTPATSAGPSSWTGGLFIGPGGLTPIEISLNPPMSATWWCPVALGRLTAGQVGGLEAGLGSMTASRRDCMFFATFAPPRLSQQPRGTTRTSRLGRNAPIAATA